MTRNDKDELIAELYAENADLRTSAAALYAELQDLRGERINQPASNDAVVFLAPRFASERPAAHGKLGGAS